MEKFIPYEKLSKKKKRELDSSRRGSWGEINPVTRKPENPKAYNRRKARNWKEPDSVPFAFAEVIPVGVPAAGHRPGRSAAGRPCCFPS